MAEMMKTKKKHGKKTKHILQEMGDVDVDNLKTILKEMTAGGVEQNETENYLENIPATRLDDEEINSEDARTSDNVETSIVSERNAAEDVKEIPSQDGPAQEQVLLGTSVVRAARKEIKTMQRIYPELTMADDNQDCMASAPFHEEIINHPVSTLYPELAIEQSNPSDGLVCSPSAPCFEEISEDPATMVSNLYPTLEEEEEEEDGYMEPLTEDQIRTLYYNVHLERLDDEVDQLFQDSSTIDHEFYRMLLEYWEALDRNRSIECDVNDMQEKLWDLEKLVWKMNSHNDTIAGHCKDGAKVQTTVSYETASVDQSACLTFVEAQTGLRDSTHVELFSAIFKLHSCKLKIENYISDFFEENHLLSIMPVQAGHRSLSLERQTDELKQLVAILFDFQRKQMITDHTFLADTRHWLTTMVSRLLMHATLKDHLFLLFHVLHCPPGISDWAVGFIQPVDLPKFGEGSGHSWDNNSFNHNVAMLAFVLKPIKYRSEMLGESVVAVETKQSLSQREKDWIVVDSEGEDESFESTNLLFHERDVMALLDQTSLDKLLNYILFPRDSNVLSITCESNFLKMFAFSRKMLNLLGTAMAGYPQLKYKRLSRKLGQLMRCVVQATSLSWQVFKSRNPEMLPQMAERVQLECDMVMLHAAASILQAPSLGAWQFMSLLPFDVLSSTSAWNLLRLLHLLCGKRSDLHFEFHVPARTCREYLTVERIMEEFAGKLMQMPNVEATFLLTTLANLARMRGSHDHHVEFVTQELFLISYVHAETRTLYSKFGRDLLQSVCLRHPHVLKTVVMLADQYSSSMGNTSTYLFRSLPVHLLPISHSECKLIRGWLVHSKPTEPSNQLARTVLDSLDWSYRWNPTTNQDADLFLPTTVHRYMATSVWDAMQVVLLGKTLTVKLTIDVIMSTQTSCSSNQGQPSKSSFFPSFSYASDSLAQFITWGWCFCMRLRLHRFSVLAGIYFFARRTSVDAEKLVDVRRTAEEFVRNPRHDDDVDDRRFQELNFRSSDGNSPLASYLLLSMTKMGYSTSEFASQGVVLLHGMLQGNFHLPALQCIHNIIPIFYPDRKASFDLINSTEFTKCIDAILKHDTVERTPFDSSSNSSLTQQFLAVILIHLELLSGNLETFKNVASFWFFTLTKVSNWSKNRDVLYVVDGIIAKIFLLQPHLSFVVDFFEEHLKQMQSSKEMVSSAGGLFSSISNLFRSRSTEFLSESDVFKGNQFRWLQFVLMKAERFYNEEDNNLRTTLELRLIGEPGDNVPSIYESVCSALGVDHTTNPINNLSIFRYASAILDTPATHEILPLLWKEFFELFFSRPHQGSSIGCLLFSYSLEGRSLTKKLKTKCNECQAELLKARNANNDAVRLRLAGLCTTISLWLDEPRLHDPRLNLHSLPPKYSAELFNFVVLKQSSPWFDFVDRREMEAELEKTTQLWFQEAMERNTRQRMDHMSHLAKSLSIGLPEERLQSHFTKKSTSHSLPAPSVEKIRSVFSDLNPDIYLDSYKLNMIINGDLKVVYDMSKSYEERLGKHREMDGYFVEQLMKLHTNITVETVVETPCRSYINPTHRCSGPAVLRKRHEQALQDENVAKRVAEVRGLISLLIKERSKVAALLTTTRAVVRVEFIILKIIKLVVEASQRGRSRDGEESLRSVIQVGVDLFYFLVSFVTPIIEHCPPAKQFSHSCIQALGETFVKDNPTQPRLVLLAVTQNPRLVCLLSQFFQPASSPDDIISLYQEVLVLSKQKKYDVATCLVAKFEMETWMMSVHCNDQKLLKMLDLVVLSLTVFGQKPSEDAANVFTVYRSQFQKLCRARIPNLHTEVLGKLLSESEKSLLSPLVWEDFVISLGFTFSSSCDFEHTFDENPTLHFNKHQVFQLLDYLAAYFENQLEATSSFQKHSRWLYSRWSEYVPHLSRLFHSVTVVAVRRLHSLILDSTSDQHAQDINAMYTKMQSLYLPWIHWFGQRGVDRETLVQGIPMLSCIVESWVRSLEAFHERFQMGVKFRANVLNRAWSTYVNDLNVQEMPEYLASVFHNNMISLPWNDFLPLHSCVNNMAKTIDYPRWSFEMMGNVFCAVDWTSRLRTLAQESSDSERTQIFSNFFDILVRLANEETILETAQLSKILDSREIFVWSSELETPVYIKAIEWFAETCDPNPLVTFDLSSKSCRIVKLFKDASDFYPQNSPSSPNHNSGQKVKGQKSREEMFARRHAYVRFTVRVIVRASSMKVESGDPLKAALGNLLSEVESLSGTHDLLPQECLSLCSECLSILNLSDPSTHPIFIEVFEGWIESSILSALIQPMIVSVCRTLANVSHLSRCLEVYIAAHFSMDVTSTEHCGWRRLLSVIEFPDLTQGEFIAECLDKEHYLTLYSFVLFRLSICRSTADELNVMLKLNDWNTSAKASSCSESKLFLWWFEIMNLGRRQIVQGGSRLAVRSALVQMVPALVQLGEDKSTQGLFGAIGFGKKSSLSLRFRVVACGMAGFVSSILGQDLNLQRNDSDNNDTLSNMLKATDAHTVAQLLQQTTSRLQCMSADRQYANYKNQINLALNFVENSSLTIMDFQTVLSQLIHPLYSDFHLGILHLANC